MKIRKGALMLKFLLILTILLSSVDAGKLEFFTNITKFVTSSPKKPINYALRNKKHPKTGVRYNKHGYPKFDKIDTCDMKLSWYVINFDKFQSNSSIRSKHFDICSKKLYKKTLKNPALKSKFSKQQLRQLRQGKTPDNFTWHHETKKNTLTLVDRQTHASTAHSGGFSIHH
jgi:hypothetical protein